MCLSARHLEILRKLNERDYISRRASLETHGRFLELFERCSKCPFFDSSVFGDVQSECRQSFLRIFVSMKRDAESYLIRKRLEAQEMERRVSTPAPPPQAPARTPSTPPSAKGAQSAVMVSPGASERPACPTPGMSKEAGEGKEARVVTSSKGPLSVGLPAQWKVARCIDASGLFCPMPIQKLSEAMRAADGDAILQFISTDPGAPGDIKAFCRATRHVLLGMHSEGERFTAWIQKKVSSP